MIKQKLLDHIQKKRKEQKELSRARTKTVERRAARECIRVSQVALLRVMGQLAHTHSKLAVAEISIRNLLLIAEV